MFILIHAVSMSLPPGAHPGVFVPGGIQQVIQRGEHVIRYFNDQKMQRMDNGGYRRAAGFIEVIRTKQGKCKNATPAEATFKINTPYPDELRLFRSIGAESFGPSASVDRYERIHFDETQEVKVTLRAAHGYNKLLFNGAELALENANNGAVLLRFYDKEVRGGFEVGEDPVRIVERLNSSTDTDRTSC